LIRQSTTPPLKACRFAEKLREVLNVSITGTFSGAAPRINAVKPGDNRMTMIYYDLSEIK